MSETGRIRIQASIEQNYYKHHVNKAVLEYLEEKYSDGIDQCAEFYKEWLDDVKANSKSPSKVERVAFLENFDLRELASKLLVLAAYETKPTLFTSLAAKAAGVLGFNDKADSIQTCSELYAVMAHTNAIRIWKEERAASLSVMSNMELSEQIQRYMNNVRFNMPMICEPLELKSNSDSPYLTVKDKLILGKGNLHGGNISLDVLNKLNKIPLSLNTQFLSTVEEEPTKVLETPEQQEGWNQFKKVSYELYIKIASGVYENRFYLPNSVDKRGRIYCRGYHVSTQGTAFKKSSIDFANKEVVTGIPEFKHKEVDIEPSTDCNKTQPLTQFTKKDSCNDGYEPPSSEANSKRDNKLLDDPQAVAAYNKDGTLYKEYLSLAEAVREFGGKAAQSRSISRVCNGVPIKDGRGGYYTPRSFKGFVWKWI